MQEAEPRKKGRKSKATVERGVEDWRKNRGRRGQEGRAYPQSGAGDGGGGGEVPETVADGAGVAAGFTATDGAGVSVVDGAEVADADGTWVADSGSQAPPARRSISGEPTRSSLPLASLSLPRLARVRWMRLWREVCARCSLFPARSRLCFLRARNAPLFPPRTQRAAFFPPFLRAIPGFPPPRAVFLLRSRARGVRLEQVDAIWRRLGVQGDAIREDVVASPTPWFKKRPDDKVSPRRRLKNYDIK